MKKVLIGIIAIIMVLGLVGCSSTPAEETNTSEPTETAPVETESQTPQDKTEFAQTVKMGEEIETEWFTISFSDCVIDTNNQGQCYIKSTFNYKNTDVEQHTYTDLEIQLLYDKKYYYDEASTARVSSEVQPLETESEEFYIWLPEEIADTDASLSMIVTYNPWEGINNDASGYGTKYQFVIQ